MKGTRLLTAVLLLALVAPTIAVGGAVPYQRRWGIYLLDLEASRVSLIYTCDEKLSGVRLNPAGDTLVFTKRFGGGADADEEICIIGVDGSGYTRLTDNERLDTYPAWSPDGSRIAFLAMGETLDLRVMDADGGAEALLYDSGYHDADIHWVGDAIAFTRNFQVWVMDGDGTDAHRVTDPPRAGEWGGAVLPFGDYDPRISPDCGRIVFERMVGDESPHGNYDLFVVNLDGTAEARLTETGWTQGMASWSHSGDRLVFVVSAVGEEGRYDLYAVSPDGTGLASLTEDLFPPGFLAYPADFSPDDSALYFVGEWWDWEILSTELSCVAGESRVTLGEELTVSGTLRPPVGGAEVALRYTGPDGATLLSVAITSEDGGYADSMTPQRAGAWRVEASWEGDPGHEASVSEAAVFNVAEARTGVPATPFLALLVGLAASVALLSRRSRAGCG
jgi:Tol biopolymer transport system component